MSVRRIIDVLSSLVTIISFFSVYHNKKNLTRYMIKLKVNTYIRITN